MSIPGSLLSSLLDEQLIDDPYVDENVYLTEELLRHPCRAECSFHLEKDVLDEQTLDLVFSGIDTLAILFVNDKKAARFGNMHNEYRIPVKEFLQPGLNHLRIEFQSALAYGEEQQKRLPLRTPHGSLQGSGHSRKAHYMFGWDWAPTLPDMGIWRPVHLEAYSTPRIGELKIQQIHTDRKADIIINIRNPEESGIWENYRYQCSLIKPDGQVHSEQSVSLDFSRPVVFSVNQPELWWPAGYGEQPLYELQISLIECDMPCESLSYKIGLRELVLDRQPDQWGESFQFKVNGKEIFAKGANLIPEEALLSKRGGKRLESLIQDCVDANFNMIRVWGGGYYPDDTFYDLCDSHGILLWHDLMFACMSYELTSAMEESIIQEVKFNVQRARHHACLALWCGNNEIAWGWAEKGWFDKDPPSMKADYHRLFDEILPRLVQETDPHTSYWFSLALFSDVI